MPTRPTRLCCTAASGRGLTLIELMIALAALAIVASLVYPSFRDQALRSRLGDAVTALGDGRAQMEQYFLDHHSYSGGPCNASVSVGSFALVCPSAATASSYTLVATGSGAAAGFVYSIDHHGSQRTTGLPSRWGTLPSGGFPCWITRQGQTC